MSNFVHFFMYEYIKLRYTIKDLDLHGTEMAYVPFEEFGPESEFEFAAP